MKLFRVLQEGFGLQSLAIAGPSLFSEAAPQLFSVEQGNFLLTIDSIVDFGSAGDGLIRYSDGPLSNYQDIHWRQPARSPAVRAALQEWD